MPVNNADQFADLTLSFVAGGAGGVGTTLGAADTTMYLPSGVGNGRPYPSTTNGPFWITIGDNVTTAGTEIVKCTARSGDQCTIIRSQGGTNQAWAVGASVRNTLSAVNLNNLYTQLGYAMMFNVRNYGAVANGATDDTSAIQAAINAASAAGGGIAYLPASNNAYKVTAALTVPANVVLQGDGPGATTISTASATLDVIQLNGTFSGVRNLHITSSVTRTAGAAINITASAYDYRVDNVRTDSMYNAIVIGNGVTIPNTIYLSNLDIHNSSNYAIYQQSGQNLYCVNVVVWQDSPSTNVAGLFWTSQNSVYMTQCTFYQCGTGVLVQPSGAITVAYGWFVNCSCDTCDTRGWMFDAQTHAGTIQQMVLVDCWGATAGTNEGLAAQGGTVQDMYIEGFRAYNNGTDGLSFYAGCSNIDVHGCRVTGNSRTTANTFYGIYFAGGVSSFSAQDNRSGAFDGFAARQSWGILVDTGAGNNFSIIGNDVTGNHNGGFSDSSTGTAKFIGQNVGYNPIGQVTIAAPSSGSASIANKWGVPVFVVLNSSGGSVTALGVAGVSLPGPPLTFVLNPGQTFTPTYTGTLSVTALAF